MARVKTKFIENNAVTNAKLAQAPTLTLKGNNTGGTANVSDLTVAQVNAILPVFTSSLNGLVPASGGGTTTFLRADGSFAAPTIANIPLTSAHILVGNGSNIATDVAMSGDITINNTGVTAIGTNKVVNSMLAQMPASTIKGNNTAGTANAADLTAGQALALISPNTTKGDLIGFSTVNARVPVGSDGQILSADSGQTLGLKYSSTLQNTSLVTMLDFSDANFLDLPKGQIRFPSTQNASSGANTLDDYEEGTYAPILQFGGANVGITYSVQTGNYTKIGNLVLVTGYLSLSSKGSSTGVATLNLPFTAEAKFSGVNFSYHQGMSSLTSVVCGYISSGTATVNLMTGSATATANISDTNFTNTSQLIWSYSYRV